MHNEYRPTTEEPPVGLAPVITRRKKLRLVGKQTGEQASTEVVLDGALHELQNCLQSIGMGVDLLQLGQPDALECRTISLGIERASRLLREMQEYFFPPEVYLSKKNVGEVVVEVVHGMEEVEKRENIHLRLPEILSPFQYDWLIFSRVLERIIRCACGLLPSSAGEIIISVKEQDNQSRPCVEINVEIHGSKELRVEEKRVFTPFWRVNDYQAGLGLMLARQAMRQRHGRLTFEKISPCRAQFSLVLEILPESAWLGKGKREASHGCVE
jgi:nitrogen-specific signal transduction histidine kinase